jgi:hypothetical protein
MGGDQEHHVFLAPAAVSKHQFDLVGTEPGFLIQFPSDRADWEFPGLYSTTGQ